MSDFITEVVEIPSENMVKLNKKVETINRKAVKNGLVPLTLNVGDVIETTHAKDFAGATYTTLSYPVTISGDYPAINGWSCIAKIDHRDGVNIINVYEELDVSKWRERKPTCDHCGHNKIKVNSYLIRNTESGEIMQIGKSCIKDYIKSDPKTMLLMLSWVSNLDELLEDEFASTGSAERYFDVADVAKVSALSIRKNGFVSVSDEDEFSIPTRTDINDYFFGNHTPEWASYWKFSNDDEVIGDATIEYFLAQDASNNFLITIKQLLELGKIRAKYFAYIAGAVSGYLKHLDREVKKATDAKFLRVNEHVGEIKKRQDFDVVLEAVFTTSGFYGTTYIHKFLDTDGHTLTWFGSGNPIEAENGDSLTIKGTVKKFDEYNGWKQTVITRVVAVK